MACLLIVLSTGYPGKCQTSAEDRYELAKVGEVASILSTGHVLTKAVKATSRPIFLTIDIDHGDSVTVAYRQLVDWYSKRVAADQTIRECAWGLSRCMSVGAGLNEKTLEADSIIVEQARIIGEWKSLHEQDLAALKKEKKWLGFWQVGRWGMFGLGALAGFLIAN